MDVKKLFQFSEESDDDNEETTSIANEIELKEDPMAENDETVDLTALDDDINENAGEVIDMTDSDENEMSETEIDPKELFNKKIFICPICDIKAFELFKIQEHLKDYHKVPNSKMKIEFKIQTV